MNRVPTTARVNVYDTKDEFHNEFITVETNYYSEDRVDITFLDTTFTVVVADIILAIKRCSRD